jgi:hypothetical protein
MPEVKVFKNPQYLLKSGIETAVRVGSIGSDGSDFFDLDEWELIVTLKKKVIAVPGHYVGIFDVLEDINTSINYWSVEDIKEYTNDDGPEEFYKDYRRVEVKEI